MGYTRERVLVLSHVQFFATLWFCSPGVTPKLAQFISLTLARILFNKNLQSERMTQQAAGFYNVNNLHEHSLTVYRPLKCILLFDPHNNVGDKKHL